ncbi:Putative resolvase [Mycobacteroides abscessus]|nr:Putative resolvase [Mycobacteroides abscessus]CPW85778.1 Putative resolvase [Mycobacteroides abscessus]
MSDEAHSRSTVALSDIGRSMNEARNLLSTLTEVLAKIEESLPQDCSPTGGEEALNVLYRMWSEQGELLYVGVTCNPGGRLNSHARQKRWWREVASTTMEQFPSRSALLEAELDAIRTENPKYNIVGRPDSERRGRPRQARRGGGLHIGRPRALGSAEVAAIKRLHVNGESATSIAMAFGVSRATVYRALAASSSEGRENE